MQQVNGVKTTLLGRKYYVKKTVTNGNIKLYQRRSNPVVKIAEKTHSFRLFFFGDFAHWELPTCKKDITFK